MSVPSEELQKRLCALGNFVLRFAETENLLFATISVLANVHSKVAQAIFSGTRAEAAIQYINRLLEIQKVADAKRAIYREIFEHFRHINDARNLILHHGIATIGTDFVATNRLTALTESRLRSVPASAEVLDQMAADVEKINALLLLNLFADEKHAQTVAATSKFGPVSQQPWLYTPPQAQKQKSRQRSGKATRK